MSRTGWKALLLNIGRVVFAVLCKILAIKLYTERLVLLRRNISITLYYMLHYKNVNYNNALKPYVVYTYQ
jgi:hypothetical protein